MKTYNYLFLLFALTLFIEKAYAKTTINQITLYKTYEDFQNNKGEEIGSLSDFTLGTGTVKLEVGTEKKEYSIKQYWGFKVDASIFRVIKNDVVFVYNVGRIVYYETGALHLRALLHNGSGWGSTVNGAGIFYYSNSLSGKIYKKFNRFKRSIDNPNQAMLTLFDAIDETYKIKITNERLKAMRICVIKLNKIE